MEIIYNEKPKLEVCEMNCDKKLHIKLDKFQMASYFNCHSTNLFIGKPQQGKTSLLFSLFKSKQLLAKVYNNIFLFQPSHSRASMKDKLFDKLPDDKKFDELNWETLHEVMTRIKNEESKYNSAIIFDDMTASLKDYETSKLLKELIFNRRHLHTSIFFLVQSWKSLDPAIRKLFNNLIIFKVSKLEMTQIFNEVLELNEDLVPQLLKLVYDKPFSYLFINVESQRLFTDWNEIKILPT